MSVDVKSCPYFLNNLILNILKAVSYVVKVFSQNNNQEFSLDFFRCDLVFAFILYIIGSILYIGRFSF